MNAYSPSLSVPPTGNDTARPSSWMMMRPAAAVFFRCGGRRFSFLADQADALTGQPLTAVRRVLARKLAVAPGTLENLRNGRAKRVTTYVFERLRAAVIRDLQQEIARCTHELEIARQAGLDPRSSDMAALETAVQKANELMGKT